MMTQISFTADQNLKKMALEKAKNEGLTLKALLTYAMKSYVENKISLHLTASPDKLEVEEVHFTDKKINQKAKKLAQLLG
jgi:hypothetical protein